jgi:hypothetical protein
MAKTPEPPASKHEHSKSCFRVSYPACSITPHSHAGHACFRRDGSLKCTVTVHVHTKEQCSAELGPLCGYV